MDNFTTKLYSIIDNHNDIFHIRVADSSHAVFQAHFPNHPILPAFLQIDIVAEIFGLDIVSINRSKFIESILPLDELMIEKQIRDKIAKVKITKKAKPISEMTFETR